jgi:Microcystin-dependent protein
MKLAVIVAAIATGLLATSVAHAQEIYAGQIIMMTSSYCPAGTKAADGSVISVRDNQMLAAIMMNTYGGDWNKGTFALPDLQGGLTVGGKTVPVRFCVLTDGIYPQRP